MARILWALISAAGGTSGQRQGLVGDGGGGSSGLVDWIGRVFALLGAFYLFRDVYADVAALVDDDAPLRKSIAPASRSIAPAPEAPGGADAFGEIAGALAYEPPSPDPSLTLEEAAPGADWAASTLVERFGDAAFEPNYALAALAALVLISGVFAAIRGLPRELAALGAWSLGLVGAAYAAPDVAAALGGDAGLMAGYAAAERTVLVFAALFLAAALALGWIARRLLARGAPSTRQRLLGFAFGAARGVALAAALAIGLRGAGAAWPALDDATAWLGLDAAVDWVIDEASPFSETIHIIKQASGVERP